MKNTLLKIFGVCIALVLMAKISHWFLKYDEKTVNIINLAMCCLIGTYYVIVGFALNETRFKLLFVCCGLYLIVMNFLNEMSIISIIGVVCMLAPMLVGKYAKAFKEA
jgi:hypothetical protein